jgi:hypothetical protein
LDEVRARARRTGELYQDGIVSSSVFEQDAAALAIAEADLQSVLAQKELLGPSIVGSGGGVTALSLRAPFRARLGALYAATGQPVSAAAPLFDLIADDSLWVRVPVYVGDLATVDREAPALIHGLRGLGTGGSGFEPRSATPVEAPPSADPNAATVDLFYELSPSPRSLQPGQKVGVTLHCKDREGAATLLLALPASAIVYDAEGGTWVYEQHSERHYQRRRVEVDHTRGGVAYLRRGPAEGSIIVSVGAAELFGAEFGVDK